MARVIYGGVGLQGLSGSINKQAGGHTFTKNNVVRRRVVPTNPQTAQQSLVRNAFAFLTTAWSGLTEDQRNAWEDARNDSYWLIPDPLTGVGRKANSGKSLFILVNFNLLQVADQLNDPTVVTTSPSSSEPNDSFLISSVVADDSSNTLTVTYTQAGSEEVLLVKSTPPVSPGTMRLTSVKSDLRDSSAILGASPATVAGKAGIYTGQTGQKVFYQIWAIHTTTGKKRLVSSDTTTIVA